MSRRAGLVKFDFLGLKTLSVLQKAVELLAKRGIDRRSRHARMGRSRRVYKLLQKGDTVGVFQLESEGMRRTLAAVRPTNFGDIIALVSLYRPGPMDNIPMFGRRKNGREQIEYPHPLLEGILSETYGIFVYQEQVMQAAQVLAGYSAGRRRHASPRDGQEDQGGDGRPARGLRRGVQDRQRHRQAMPRRTSCST
jgi:DNA polymerase-3 subunit alpha